jgi:hypothetical protein
MAKLTLIASVTRKCRQQYLLIIGDKYMTGRLTMLIVIKIVSLLLYSTPLYASEKSVTDYKIVGAWYDNENIYLRYHKTTSRVEFSPRNIDGKVLNRAIDNYILAINKNRIDDKEKSFKLSGAVTNDIYSDTKIKIQSQNNKLVVSGDKVKTNTYECDNAIWDIDNVIKHKDVVQICGKSISGDGVVKNRYSDELIANLINEIGRDNKKSSNTLSNRYNICSININGTDYFAHRNKIINDNKLIVYSKSSRDEIYRHNIGIGNDDTIKVIINGINVYSPNRFILSSLKNNELYVCSYINCHRLAPNKTISFLIIEKNKYYIVYQHKFTEPFITIVSGEL